MISFVGVLAACLVLVAVSDASVLREKRQAANPYYNNNCINDGEYEYPEDCSRYLRCDNGVATIMSCGDGRVFNRDRRMCDWPQNVPGCNTARQALKAEFANLCTRNDRPNANRSEAFLVGHPRFCNGFLKCTEGYLFPGCQFCPGGYFDNVAGYCVAFDGRDPLQFCSRDNYVPMEDNTVAQLSDECWFSSDRENPFRAQYEMIMRSRGYRSDNNNNYPYRPPYNPNQQYNQQQG